MDYKFCPQCGGPLIEKHLEGRMRKICSECEFIFYQNPAPAAGVALQKDGKLLLVKRKFEPKQGDWSLPAGFVEYDESPAHAAIRETKEETGFDVKISGLLNVYGACDDPRSHVVLIIYNAEIQNGELKPGDDALDAKFFPFDEIPENIAFSSHRTAINLFISNNTNQ